MGMEPEKDVPRGVVGYDPAEGQATVDLAEVAELNRPRRNVTYRLMAWTLVLVMVPTVVCAFALDHITRRTLSENHARNAYTLGHTVASSLAGHIANGLSREAIDTFDTVSLDHRLGFAHLTDRAGKPLYLRVASDSAWSCYNDWLDSAAADHYTMDAPISLGGDGALIAWRVPVWSAARHGEHRAASRTLGAVAEGRTLEGYLVIGLWEPALGETLAKVRLTVICVSIAVLAVMLPIIALAVRRWAKPLRQLIDATTQLAAGYQPPPVDAKSGDEISVLAGAFNRMASRQSTMRRELQRSNAELENTVAGRTAELLNAKAQLETEIRDKNEFLRTVSHDLNAPLRNISGMANMLLLKYKNVLADDALNKLERINANVKSQTDLIKDLLDLSRLRTTPGHARPIDLGMLITQIRDTLAFDLEKQQITVEVTTGLPTIVVDKNRIRQVFQNLLDNAIKYMLDAAERRIEISCTEDDQCYTFCVQDTGRGICDKDLPNIFQLYKRALHSGTHQVAGRGVGLAGCKTIVETYGGRIWVTSVLGQGSAFYFTLAKSAVADKVTLDPVPAGGGADE